MPAAVASLGPLIRRKGWPKELPCLFCGRPRLATAPGDRYHAQCRKLASPGSDAEGYRIVR